MASLMKIDVLCTDPRHPVLPYLQRWKAVQESLGHDVNLINEKADLSGGDLLFLVSCSQVLNNTERGQYRAALVLHASDLPKGRGWSPHVWAILAGESEVTVCLLEAQDPVDSGLVWLRTRFALDGSELLPEINQRLFLAELNLMTEAVQRVGSIEPSPQQGDPGPYMKRRTPADSRLDPHKTIAEQFDLLRTVDSERYPAFFDFRGHRYVIKIDKVDGRDR